MVRRAPHDASETAGTPETEAGPSTDREGTEGRTTRTPAELLRWAIKRLVSSPAVALPFVLIAIAVTVAEAGITTVPTDFGRVPRFAPWVWPVYVGSILGGWVGLGAVFLAARDAQIGSGRSHSRRLLAAAERLPSMLAVAVIGGIPVVGGLFAFLVPGIYFMVKFALALPAAAIDDLGPAAALRRSFVTTDGHFIRISTLLVSFALVVILSSVVVTLLIGGSAGNGFLGPLVQNLVTAVLLPTYGLAFGRMYPVSGPARS